MLSDLIYRFRVLFGRKSMEADMDEELHAHLEHKVKKYVQSGVAVEEAKRRARLDLGGLEQVKEECRDSWGLQLIEELVQDFRYGLRQLRRNPGFTMVAVLTLALGIGANTAMFSIINGFLLRPLPVSEPDQLMFLGFVRPGINNFDDSFSYPEYEEAVSQDLSMFSGISAMKFGGTEGGQARQDGLTVNGVTKPIEPVFVTGDFFSMLGIRPYLGRLILPSEGSVAGGDAVIVLSYRYWATRFGKDSSIVGKKASVNGHPVTIVGIAPKGFVGVTPMFEMQGYLPLGMATIESGVSPGFMADSKARTLVVLARKNASAEAKQTSAALSVVGGRLLKQFPRSSDEKTLRAYPLRPPGILTGPDLISKLVGLFLVLAGLVLALACVNVANLVLARTVSREREMVVRAAVGASRGRLLRQLLTESLLLAVLGCVGGIVAGILVSSAVSSLPLPTELPVVMNFQFDWRVFAYACVAAGFAVALVGIAPAIRGSGIDLRTRLQTAGRSLVGSRHRLRQALLALQVAGSLALLIVAGLFVGSLRNAEHADLGFDANHILNLSLDPSEIGYTVKRGSSFYNDVLDRVQSLPGVQSASLALAVPLGDSVFADTLKVPGYRLRPGQPPPSVLYNAVSPGYFKTLGIGILSGRDLSREDDENSPHVPVINEAMAEKFWPNQNAVGKQFTMGGDSGQSIEVVGVAKNIRLTGVSGPFDPCFYLPIAQHYASGATLQIRTVAAPDDAARPAIQLIHSISPTMPILRVETMKQSLGGLNGLFGFEFGAGLTGALGLLGLVLASVGIFGVTSYVVGQRTQEIGIRMALGARRRQILWNVLSKVLKSLAIGIGLGILLEILISTLLVDFLVGVKPTDPLTIAAVTLILTAVALLASYIPARRAAKVDPMVALRYE